MQLTPVLVSTLLREV